MRCDFAPLAVLEPPCADAAGEPAAAGIGPGRGEPPFDGAWARGGFTALIGRGLIRRLAGKAAGAPATQHAQPRKFRRWCNIMIPSIACYELIQSTSLPSLWTAIIADTMACCGAACCRAPVVRPTFNE